jgi:hypothetical protein
MAAEMQEYEDDPIIAALGITQDARPVVPPIDIVYGYFQNVGDDFRLYRKEIAIYMQTQKARIKFKDKVKDNGTRLVLRADDDYEKHVKIGYTSLAGEQESGAPEPMHRALYARYAYETTTPWHEW